MTASERRDDPAVDQALKAARAAALDAGVDVREVAGLEEMEAVTRLFATIWGRDDNPPVTSELLRAFTKHGNYVGGAFEGNTLLGACVGFFGDPAEVALHSHVTGVSGAAFGRSIGFALKLHQRGWTMSRGVSQIAWTFDPLVRRNAYFNLSKLATRPVEYLPNFYGAMQDEINGLDDTDRLLVHWCLVNPKVAAACAGNPVRIDAAAEIAAGAVVALDVSGSGGPAAGLLNADVSLVAVPADIETMRTADPRKAYDWRMAVRDTLTALVADGGRIDGFDREGWYVVRRSEPSVAGPRGGSP